MFTESQIENPFTFTWNLEWGDFRDVSVLGLIASNIVVIVWALIENWDLGFLLLVYWAQSVIIGIFWFYTIITYKNAYRKYTEDPFELPEKLNEFSRLGLGLFFVIHFGFFHFVYFIFLLAPSRLEQRAFEFPLLAFVIIAGLFFINQLNWSIKFAGKSEHKPANIGKLMGFPYVRIIPIHLMIMFGGLVAERGLNPRLVLLIFLTLKTVADVIMHVQQKKGFADEPLNMNAEDVVPHLISVPKSVQVVLSDGKVVSLKGKDELAKKLKSIRSLPLEVQAEVYNKLLTREDQHEDKQAKVTCQCDRANRFKGKGVVEYVKRHLKLTGTTGGGTRVYYMCPETGKKWTREGYTLTAYKNKPGQ
ncbi:MAG: DUF6498-containing protein [Planctomycetota bacterium]|jgi:hypothetical protein